MAHVVRVADGFVEIVFSGQIEPDVMQKSGARLSPAEAAAVGRTGRVLFDFTDIDSFGFDAQQLGLSMQRLAANGVRLAVYSSNPRFFGVGRQIALYSGLEGSAIAVFDSRPEAVGWLLGRRE